MCCNKQHNSGLQEKTEQFSSIATLLWLAPQLIDKVGRAQTLVVPIEDSFPVTILCMRTAEKHCGFYLSEISEVNDN